MGNRVWVLIPNERIRYGGSNLNIEVSCGADDMDPGKYKGGSTRTHQLDKESLTVEATESGALRDKALSATAQVVALMVRLMASGSSQCYPPSS
ncbi:hypothetical protein G7Y79_00010g029260 [Physcia stellaris]|nr:hypothetical protein G7Y79_00010g029260 [Physcia stellaris]